MNNIHWIKTNQGTKFFLKDVKVGTAITDSQAEDNFVFVEEGVICWTRRTKKSVAEMRMRFEADYRMEYQLIPALQYNQNQCYLQDYVDVRNSFTKKVKKEKEEKKEPTYFTACFDKETNQPWRFGWHRMSIPGASYSEGNHHSVAMFLPPTQMEGACSIYPEQDYTVHEMLWPEQDGPLPVMTGGRIVENFKKEMESRQDFQVMLVINQVEKPRQQWHKLLDAAWKQYYSLRPPVRSYENLWELGIAYTKALYTEEDDGFKGFSIGFTWKDGAWIKRPDQKYEIGWCGQNASFANSLLIHAKMTGDQEAKEMAINVLDAWIAATRPNGLIPTHYDDNQYTNGFAKTVDACNLGTAAVQLFEAEQNATALGVNRPEYGKMACRICDFALSVMDEQGRIGKSWLEENLFPAVKEGTTGAFLTMALCEGARITSEQKYLSAAQKSCDCYIKELNDNGYTTAGALDIFSIDKESSIPLLKSSILLYRMTKNAKYLTYAENAAWYLSTWQWHYTKPYPCDSLLAQLEFDTFGGTAVSIHGGMDPYALFYVHELCDLAESTGNEQWHQRAGAIWRNGQQGISDGDLILDGKAPRPKGSQDESISYTYGIGENSPSQWLVAWPSAFRLEALRKILPQGSCYEQRIF